MKKFRIFISALTASVFFLSLIFTGRVFSFYTDYSEMQYNMAMGSAGISIVNFHVNGNEVSGSGAPDGILETNSSVVFSFDLRSTGISSVNYTLRLQIAWKGDLSEAGKFFVFPHFFSDEKILENINNGTFDDSIIDNTDDRKKLDSSWGVSDGIDEIVENGVFNKINPSKSFGFKLFLFEDTDIASDPVMFHNKDIEIAVTADADVPNRKTNWAASDKKFFQITSSADLSCPVITEAPLPKTFFVTQSKNINLADYARAHDTDGRDITGDIVISSVPEFTPGKAGTYTIVFSVKNSAGRPAVPLQIHLTVWTFEKIESGFYHTLALTSHGKVYSWGYNYYGQLGNGTITSLYAPEQIQGLDNITDIAAGNSSSYALTNEGQIFVWGSNSKGQLGIGNNGAKITRPVLAEFDVNLRFVQISSKYETAGGVTDSGEVYLWGYGGSGILGNGLDSDDRFLPEKTGLSDVSFLSLGYDNGAAVTNDGVLYIWGDNTYGQLGTGGPVEICPPSPIPFFAEQNIKIADVSAGGYHIAAISADGRLFTWGFGGQGQLGNGSASSKYIPFEIGLPSAAVKAAAGGEYTGVLTADGTVFMFGDNTYGKLGTGDENTSLAPAQLKGIPDATYLCLAMSSTLVLTADGDVFGMGYGGMGTLGTGGKFSTSTPAKWAFVPPPAVYFIFQQIS